MMIGSARHPISVADYRRLASKRLPRMVFDYLEGGAGDERGLQHNAAIWDRFKIKPRRLVDVRRRSQAVTLFGREQEMPVVVAPTGLNALFWPEGDIELAKAAEKAGIPFVLSSAANASIEDIARQSQGDRWFQLYVVHREIAAEFVTRARDADYSTLVVTADVIINGNRERDIRNGFALPARYTPRTLIDGLMHPRWSFDFLRHGVPNLANFTTARATNPEAQAALMSRQMDASFSFDDLARLRDIWSGPMVVKGLLHEEDVRRCRVLGMDGVVLSNHGGRQIDGAVAPIEVLQDCITAAGEMTVIVDSGFRRGEHIVTALTLGAGAVMLGRPLLYGLAARGRSGVSDVLRLLRAEIDNAMVQIGCSEIEDLKSDLVVVD